MPQPCSVRKTRNFIRNYRSASDCIFNYTAVEGDDVLDTLLDKTSSRTVPQVFIKGEYIGGADGKTR